MPRMGWIAVMLNCQMGRGDEAGIGRRLVDCTLYKLSASDRRSDGQAGRANDDFTPSAGKLPPRALRSAPAAGLFRPPQTPSGSRAQGPASVTATRSGPLSDAGFMSDAASLGRPGPTGIPR